MKLHLPKGLRAALLAVLTVGAALTTTVQAATFSSSGCTYKEIGKLPYQTEWWASYEKGTVTELENNKPSDGFALDYMPDANLQDWVLTLDAYNLSPVVEDNEALGMNIFCTTGATVDPETDEVTLNAANSLAIFLSPTGDLRIGTTLDDTDRLRNNILIGNVGRDWVKDIFDDAVSLRVILAWDADGGQPLAVENGRYGALTLVGAYILSNDDGHAILSEVESHYTGTVVMDNYVMPKNLFGWTEDDRPAYSVAGGGQVKATQYSQGLDRTYPWVPVASWMISGDTSINRLLHSDEFGNPYYDEINGEYRGFGSWVCTNPSLSTDKQTVSDTITFTGSKGALILTEAIGDGEDYELDNGTITYTVDPYSADPQAVAGFGTICDQNLRVDIKVIDKTALSEGACGLRIVGTGTTILEIDNTGLKRYGNNLQEGEAFQGTQGEFEAHLAQKKLDITGLRIQEATAGDNRGYWFAIKDTDKNKSITFAEIANESTVVLSPKGNGNIILNMHASNIGTQSQIIMRDEVAKTKPQVVDITEPVLVPKLAWGYVDGNVLGTPVYDDYGNPIYSSTIDAPLQNDEKKNVYTRPDQVNIGERGVPAVYYETVDVADGSPVYRAWADCNWTDEQFEKYGIRKVETTTGEGEAAVTTVSYEYDVRNVSGQVVYTITLDYVPDLVQHVKPVMDPNNPNLVSKQPGTTIVVTRPQSVKIGEETILVWDDSKNPHTAIEKTVGETYVPVQGPMEDAYAVARPIAGTEMHLQLYSEAIDTSNSKGGYFINEIEGGDIVINGRKAVMGLNKVGETVQTGGLISHLTASGISTDGTLIVDSHLTVTGNIEASDIQLQSGITKARKVTAGSIFVSSAGLVQNGGGIKTEDPHGSTLVAEEVELSGGSLFVFGGAEIGTLTSDNAVYIGTGVNADGSAITNVLADVPQAWLTVDNATATGIYSPWISITTQDGTAQKLFSGRTDIFYDITPTVDYAMRSDIQNTGLRFLRSKHINGGVDIAFLTKDGVLIAETMEGSNVSYAEIGTLATGLAHQGGVLSMSISGTISTGTITAESFNMPDNYSIKAAGLNVTTLTVPGKQPEVATLALRRAASSTDTVYENVSMTNAVVVAGSATSAGSTLADSITAKSIVLGEGHYLGGNSTTLQVTTTSGLTASDNTTLNNVAIKGGDLTTCDKVTINSLSMENGKFRTLGDATIYNMTLSNVPSFGGEAGNTFKYAATSGAKLTFDGKLTQEETDNSTSITLTLNRVDIDASGDEFTVKDGESFEYTLLETTDGGTVDARALNKSNSTFKVQAYTVAELDVNENGELVLKGKNQESVIKKELVGGSEVRQATMDAVNEACKLSSGGTLAALHDAMGMVMENPSVEARRQILDSMSGASLTALADSQRRGVQNVQNSLRNRIIQMGGNADWENAGIQAWAQADGAFSTTKTSDEAPGYDYTAWGATVGANIDLAETVTAGMSLSASYGEIESDHADKATGDSNAYYVNLFARHQTGRWTQMLILTAGQNDMTLERTVGSYTAEGDTSGSTFSAYYEVGYTLGLNNEFTHIIQPIVSARITSAKVDGYEEKGSIGNAALSYDGGSYTYGTIAAGFRYQGVMYESVFERNAVLEVRAMVTSDFGDTTDTAKVALGQGKMREVEGVDTTGTGFDFGVGLSIPMEMQTTLFFDADLNMRPDYTGVSANVGLRYDF